MIEDWKEYVNFLFVNDQDFEELLKNELGVRRGMNGFVQLGESCVVTICDLREMKFILNITFLVDGNDEPFQIPFNDNQSILIKLVEDEKGKHKIILLKFLDSQDDVFREMKSIKIVNL